MITKATHVLTWLPPGYVYPAPIWQLREAAAPETVIREWSSSPTDGDPADLAEWVNDTLGVPVHLGIRQETRIGGRLFGRTVPMYYVFPGER